MVPLDTNGFITAWLPLRPLSPADAGLEFASGSHRDFALPYWQSEEGMQSDLQQRYPDVETYNGLGLGDATWHHGCGATRAGVSLHERISAGFERLSAA